MPPSVEHGSQTPGKRRPSSAVQQPVELVRLTKAGLFWQNTQFLASSTSLCERTQAGKGGSFKAAGETAIRASIRVETAKPVVRERSLAHRL